MGFVIISMLMLVDEIVVFHQSKVLYSVGRCKSLKIMWSNLTIIWLCIVSFLFPTIRAVNGQLLNRLIIAVTLIKVI